MRRLPLLLLACCLAAGLWSVLAGTDRNWDLRNYQLYVAFAWLEGRLFQDVAAAQMQAFYNPVPHLPWYGLLRGLNDYPRLFAFVGGLPAGVLAFLFLRVAHAHAAVVVPGRGVALLLAAVAGLAGLTGAAFVPAIGLSSADAAVAVPVMAAYALVLRAALRRGTIGERPSLAAMAGAGLLLGLAGGLKMTAAPFGAAIGLMILATLGLRAAAAAGLALAAGFLLTWAPHALTLWRETGNPLFPHFNHVFRSPLLPAEAIRDERFLPRSALQAVLYPFWWLRETSGLVTELRFRDWRIPLGYLAALAALPPLLAGRAGAGARAAWLLLGACALSYALWAWLFGVYRYLIVLEMLACLLPMLAAALWARGRWRPVLAVALLAAVAALATTVRPNWGHGRHGAQVISVPPLPVPPGALLLATGDEPHGYLAVFMPRDARMMNLGANFITPAETALVRRMREVLAAHQGPVWSVSLPEAAARRDATLARFGLAIAGPCETVRTSLDAHAFCPLRKFN
ncbi:hypothetical protein ACI6QG_07740 [Roseococcus sp. DSY-14]|uniref:hypothetical protein n=1 Tax=Roseococcus sp. DSY-14 TaxID=3369650 RepID=UPI00387B551B